MISTSQDLSILMSAIKTAVRSKAFKQWHQNWDNEAHDCTFKWWTLTSTKTVLDKFKQTSHSEESILIQMQTEKIGLEDYLFKIKAWELSQCSCESNEQTV